MIINFEMVPLCLEIFGNLISDYVTGIRLNSEIIKLREGHSSLIRGMGFFPKITFSENINFHS